MAMNSSDSDEPAPDRRICETVRSLPNPEPPADLESRVRQRIRRRRIERAVLVSGAGLTLVGALLVWQPWSQIPAPVVQQPQPAPPVASATPTPPREIPPDELAVLFAPPPVDSLTIVGGRNDGWVEALNRLEDKK